MQNVHGPIMQFAYLVPDLRVAARTWAEQFAVGPFVAFEHVEYRENVFRGQKVSLDLSIAFACSGDVQIELVAQHDSAPSIFSEFRGRCGFGLQHLGALTDDIEAATLELSRRRMAPVQSMTNVRGTRTAFFETELQSNIAFELIERSPGVEKFFSDLRTLASNWDGKLVFYEPGK